MDHRELLIDAFDRIRDGVHRCVRDLDPDALGHRVASQANSISWLVWHLTRIQDDHVADVAGAEQVWLAGWAERCDLPLDPVDTGYGHAEEQVSAVRLDAEQLLGYHDATHDRTVDYLRSVTAADLDRVVDERWDPPVTLGVRLVSVVEDDLQHVGQAAFVRGLLQR